MPRFKPGCLALGLLWAGVLSTPIAPADEAGLVLRLLARPGAGLLWRRAAELPGFESLARQAVANTQWSLWKRFTPGEDLPTLLARLSPQEMERALRVPEIAGISGALERARLRIRAGAGVRPALAQELAPLTASHAERVRFIRAREASASGPREEFLAGTPARAVHEFAPGEYRDIRDLALEILARFPPERFFYLGVGRSPTPLIAFLEELAQVRASTIPFALPSGGAPAEAVDAHLARLLPGALDGRALLAIDLTASGRTLVEFEAALRRSGARGPLPAGTAPQLRARVLALAEAVPARDGAGTIAVDWTLTARDGAPIEVIALDRYPVLNRRMKASAYDDVAAFESHRVGSDGDPIPGDAYGDFRTLLRQRMEADTAVSGFLR